MNLLYNTLSYKLILLKNINNRYLLILILLILFISMQNSILLIIIGSILGILLLYLLKKYFNGGKCTINEDLSRKVIFITGINWIKQLGGNGGIGAETAKILGKMKGTIIIACRDVRKANILLDEIKNEFRDSGDLYSLKMDLTDLGSIDSALE